MAAAESYHHETLVCGLEAAALAIPGRRTVSFEFRMFAGLVNEPADKLGLARLVEETLEKGTAGHSARELTDAFDAIGVQRGGAVGRESIVLRCACLPEHLDRALALHAEMIRTPTFPDEFCKVAVSLSLQELTALEDEPGDLARKLIAPRAYGPLLGRHELGERGMLEKITREDVIAYWRRYFGARRMQFTLAGAVDVDAVRGRLSELFAGFAAEAEPTRGGCAIEFTPGAEHHQKELEQQHILICWPGVKMTDPEYATERLVLAVLGDGMSSRLFTEVREKQGLVYWVGAWKEQPRDGGMMFMGASTTPARCDQTVRTLLREVDRLAEDITGEELERAKVGIIAKTQTHGDITRARASELSSDLLHFGRPVRVEEKNGWISRVSLEDVRRYLREHPRDRLCMLTLGQRPLEAELVGRCEAGAAA